jgi:ankyrin repeat protein
MDSLPPELQYNIIINTNPADLGRIACISKYFRGFCEEPALWRAMYMAHFGGPFLDMRGYKMSLIKNVCEIDYCDTLQEKVIWATKKGHYSTVRRLLQNVPTLVNQLASAAANHTILHLACLHKHIEVVRVLLSFNVDAEQTDNEGITALHIASELGCAPILEMLLRVVSHVHVNHKDLKGRAAIHKAVYQGHFECVQVLLQSEGIDIHLLEGSYGQTPLHVACGRGFADIVKVLIQHKANVNAVDRDGWTPLHNACYKGYPAVVSVLLGHQAKRDILISNRHSAFSLAENKGYHDILHLFRTVPQAV